jgi:hypothetical protein
MMDFFGIKELFNYFFDGTPEPIKAFVWQNLVTYFILFRGVPLGFKLFRIFRKKGW